MDCPDGKTMAYPLSLRHIEEMMRERGVFDDHATVHRWAIKMVPVLAAEPEGRLDFFTPKWIICSMTASIYLLPQKRWRQSGPCSDAEFQVLGFGRMAHAVGPRSRRR